MGVDRAKWPDTAKAARNLMNGLPLRLGGQIRQVDYSPAVAEIGTGAVATVSYGDEHYLTVAQEYRADLDGSGTLRRFSANNLLAAEFGLVYACAKDTYAGTAPHDADSPIGPDVTAKPVKRAIWFSCTIDAAEGDDDYTGHAVGWTSKRTAWLVVAEDERSARTLVRALQVEALQAPAK